MIYSTFIAWQLYFVPVNHRGGWLFVELSDADGNIGWGEASHSGDDQRTMEVLRPLLAGLVGQRIDATLIASLGSKFSGEFSDDKCGRTALSAVEQALTDLFCRRNKISVTEYLNSRPLIDEAAVTVYSNVNRMCADRSPQSVAQAARQAVDQGVQRLKFAPFDEVSIPALCAVGASVEALTEPGRLRLEALRDAVGRSVYLMVDCHWRFSVEALPFLERIASDLDIKWLEDPVPDQTLEVADRLRDRTGAQVTGGEHLLTHAEYEKYIRTSGVDVVIADVKHVGGISAMFRIAQMAEEHGMQFAPHNPSGPISTAASAHVVFASPNSSLLEYPFGEIDWRSDLAPNESLLTDQLTVIGPGLGVNLRGLGKVTDAIES
ncbi:MAG: mandelate racemase/muconate lactonizing enzyme family protein [Burkholderiaceae bacterium]